MSKSHVCAPIRKIPTMMARARGALKASAQQSNGGAASHGLPVKGDEAVGALRRGIIAVAAVSAGARFASLLTKKPNPAEPCRAVRHSLRVVLSSLYTHQALRHKPIEQHEALLLPQARAGGINLVLKSKVKLCNEKKRALPFSKSQNELWLNTPPFVCGSRTRPLLLFLP